MSESTLVSTRLALHRLATYVIAPARYRVTDRFGLRSIGDGFGTPQFEGRQIRVSGDELIDVRDGHEVRHPITTLRAAADALESDIDPETAAEHDSPPLGDVDEPLEVDAAASRSLGDFWTMGTAALEQVRAAEHSVDPSIVQLWPGHFDAAVEVGDDDHRASYGASPGDPAIPEPYCYVSIWWPDRVRGDLDDPFFSASSFRGAVVRARALGDVDPAAAAAEFYLEARDRIEGRA